MSKWFGKIGYAITDKKTPGVWSDTVTERSYYGDMTSNRFKRQNSSGVNDNLLLSNVISIVADPFAEKNYSHMAYVEIMGTKWKITDVEIQYPRLILTTGGVWNGNSPGTSE